MPLGLHIIFDAQGPGLTEVWRMLQQSHPDLLSGPESCEVSGVPCSLSAAGYLIQNRVKPHFRIRLGTDNGLDEIRYGQRPLLGLSLLCIERILSGLSDADIWVLPFLDCDSFRQGLLFDCEYDYWQNAEYLWEYTTVGKSYAHLPTKSNGKPPPLEETIIDISANTGRRVFRNGYVEAVGAVMWFGGSFWRVAESSRQDVLASDLVSCSEQKNGIIRVQAAEQPFTSAEGDDGMLQRNLRELIFPSS